jgi:Lon protease-like protein
MNLSQLTIPMFPLNVVVLPGETMKLHIFEERYKQLINDCLENEAEFGISYVHSKKMNEFGSQVRVKKVLKRSTTGEMDILIEGTDVFKLIEFSEILSPKLYGAGVIQPMREQKSIQSAKLQELVIDYFSQTQDKLLQYDTVKQLSVYDVASQLLMTTQDKYKLIASESKETFLLLQLKLMLQIMNTESQLKDRFLNN